jgi:hypothetical protein
MQGINAILISIGFATVKDYPNLRCKFKPYGSCLFRQLQKTFDHLPEAQELEIIISQKLVHKRLDRIKARIDSEAFLRSHRAPG